MGEYSDEKRLVFEAVNKETNLSFFQSYVFSIELGILHILCEVKVLKHVVNGG
jgi:hypothetical protein